MSGSYYELAMEFARDDQALAKAVAAVRPIAPAEMIEVDDMRCFKGRLDDLSCAVWIVREQTDWLDVSIETSELEARGIAYPIYDSPRAALDAIDRTLISVAKRVYAAAPFALGLIGEEVSGSWTAASLEPRATRDAGLLLPEALLQRVGLTGERIADDLFWVPRP